MSKSQSSQAHQNRILTFQYTFRKVGTYTYRYCRTTRNFRWILVHSDSNRQIRWPEAFPIKDISAHTIAKTLTLQYICRFGVPNSVTTNRGSQFESKLFSELNTLRGITRIRNQNHSVSSTSERASRTFSQTIKSFFSVQS